MGENIFDSSQNFRNYQIISNIFVFLFRKIYRIRILKSFRIVKIYRIYFRKIYRIVVKTFRIKKLYRIYFVFLFGIYWIYRRTSLSRLFILSIYSDVTPWATPARTARTWRVKSARTAGTTSSLLPAGAKNMTTPKAS